MSTQWLRTQDHSPEPSEAHRFYVGRRPDSIDEDDERAWHADASRPTSLHYVRSSNVSTQDIAESIYLHSQHRAVNASTERLTDLPSSHAQQANNSKSAQKSKNYVSAATDRDQPAKRGRAFYLSFICLCSIAYLTSLDAVIVAAALPDIADDLKADSEAAF